MTLSEQFTAFENTTAVNLCNQAAHDVCLYAAHGDRQAAQVAVLTAALEFARGDCRSKYPTEKINLHCAQLSA